MVIGGQHGVAALKQKHEQPVARKLDVPEVFSEVVARVLRPDVPVGERQYAARDHQAGQSAVQALQL
jgi:hypothetical protein